MYLLGPCRYDRKVCNKDLYWSPFLGTLKFPIKAIIGTLSLGRKVPNKSLYWFPVFGTIKFALTVCVESPINGHKVTNEDPRWTAVLRIEKFSIRFPKAGILSMRQQQFYERSLLIPCPGDSRTPSSHMHTHAHKNNNNLLNEGPRWDPVLGTDSKTSSTQ